MSHGQNGEAEKVVLDLRRVYYADFSGIQTLMVSRNGDGNNQQALAKKYNTENYKRLCIYVDNDYIADKLKLMGENVDVLSTTVNFDVNVSPSIQLV